MGKELFGGFHKLLDSIRPSGVIADRRKREEEL